MTQQLSVSPRAWAGLVLLATIWGCSFLTVRIALDEVPIPTIVAIRVGGAAIMLWAVVLGRRIAVPGTPRVWTGIALMGLFNNAIPFSLIAWGQQHIPSGLAAILNAATAIFGVLIAALVFADERLTGRKALGVGLGFLGVATALGLSNLTSVDPRSLGQWAVVLAALSYGISGSIGRAFLKGVPPLVSAAGMLSASALVMVPVALLHDGLPSFNYAPQTILSLAFLSLVGSGIAYLIFYRVLALAGAGNLSLVTLLIVPVAIVVGAVVLGELLRPQAYAGFALLAAGLLIIDGRLLDRWQAKGPVANDRPPECP